MGHLGDNIANTVIPMGLPPQEVGPFIGLLTSQNFAGLMQLPNVTPEMAQAAGGALLNTYASSFQHVWIAAAAFVAVAAIGMFHNLSDLTLVLTRSQFPSSLRTRRRNSTCTSTLPWRTRSISTATRLDSCGVDHAGYLAIKSLVNSHGLEQIFVGV